LGTHRNAVRVHPDPDDLAHRCELRVLDRDPHADAIPWPGPSVTSITEPIDLGPFEAEPCRVLVLRRHAIVGGATGSGKSGGLNELIANLAACRDVVIWAIDLKRGMEFQPWAACLDRLATTPDQAAALLADAVTILYARAQHLADHGRREWEPSQRMPALVIIVDEYAELAEQAPAALKHTDTIARLGRAPAVTLVLATQRPTQKVMGHSAVRSQMNISRRALTAPPTAPPDETEPGGPGQAGPGPAHPEDTGNDEDSPEDILQSALSRAPDQASPSPSSWPPPGWAGGGSTTGSANCPPPAA
jgi:hypothetical protein